ncbi:hypothetical protein GCM10022235_28980 [Kribbella ginsengisoli]|uniref:Uncharacterized protein n=1 Tax=Kribbella ginsengisoli TaxID=363865 RepID=A0ABP6X0J7_9ACTN
MDRVTTNARRPRIAAEDERGRRRARPGTSTTGNEYGRERARPVPLRGSTDPFRGSTPAPLRGSTTVPLRGSTTVALHGSTPAPLRGLTPARPPLS